MKERYYVANPLDWSYKVATATEWARQFGTLERHIADDRLDGWGWREVVWIEPVRISTVWLGLDHNWRESGPPHLFETIIFGGPCAQDQDRYENIAFARQGHERLCRRASLARWIGGRLARWLS